VNATKNDRRARHLRGRPRQLQAVAGEVGQVLDLSILIIMREDRGILSRLEGVDLVVDRVDINRVTGGSNRNHRKGILVFVVAQEEPTRRT